MPTKRNAKVRRLLKSGKAKIIQREPFTIQLTYETENTTQPITIGICHTASQAAFSACTETEELYASHIKQRDDISYRLKLRKQLRSTRRSRKTRHRKCRFDNRRHDDNWVAPSIKARIQVLIDEVKRIQDILPISSVSIRMDSASTEQSVIFDRHYVLKRDGYRCCHCGSKTGRLEVHHIDSRLNGNDNPENLITLCEDCHHKHHAGLIDISEDIKAIRGAGRGQINKVLDPLIYRAFRQVFKTVRIDVFEKQNTGEKSLQKDARRLAAKDAEPAAGVWIKRKVRSHNRQISAMLPNRGGIRKSYKTPYISRGFRVNDKVHYGDRDWFVKARRWNSLTLESITGKRIDVNREAVRFIDEARFLLTAYCPRRNL